MQRDIVILGFDPGYANMGYACLTGSLRTPVQFSQVHLAPQNFGVFTTEKRYGNNEAAIRDRIDNLGAMAGDLIKRVKPTYIAIEDFTEQGLRVGKTYKEMAFLIEHMRLLSRSNGIEADIYYNSYWKMRTLKARTVNKAQVKHYVGVKLPEAKTILANQPDHVWDSACIALCKWYELTEK